MSHFNLFASLMLVVGCQSDGTGFSSSRDEDDNSTAGITDDRNVTDDTVTTGVPSIRPEPVKGRNVLLVTLDATRADQATPGISPGFMGGKTREIGLTLESHWSIGNWTRVSFPTMLSGKDPRAFGEVVFEAEAEDVAPIDDEAILTLPEILDAEGYTSYWDNASSIAGSKVGLDDGWTDYLELDKSSGGNSQEFGTAVEQGQRVIEWIEIQPGPWFAAMHLLEPHDKHSTLDDSCADNAQDLNDECPFDTINGGTMVMNDEAEGWSASEIVACQTAIKAAHDCEVTWTDAALHGFVKDFQNRGLFGNTVFVITFDHGEEHGQERGGRSFWNHKQALYAEETRVFAWVWWPENEGPEFVDYATGHSDLVPTILYMLGVEPPPDIDGMAVWDVPEGRPVSSVFKDKTEEVYAAVSHDGTRHYIRDVGDEETYLFDPEEDPEELKPLDESPSEELVESTTTDY